ncbi:MAG TPA: DnaA/Hda family protein, partial [Elusimicrobiales bacterium]|nr:DnaA/Hda family protein [Elusimicrobiales bacterium]
NFVIYLFRLEQDTLSRINGLVAELRTNAEPAAAAPQQEDMEGTRRVLVSSPEVQPKAAPPKEKPPVSAPPAFVKPQLRPGPIVPPSVPARKQEAAPPAAKPAEKPAEKKPAENKPVKAAPVPQLIKVKWSVELPLVPTHSFQTLVSGSHNRFAHAAAMAVVDNPGVMYNPLLIFGVPGTGKTHFVHAISYGLSSSIGQNNIFVTDGIKLSKGVEIAVANGAIERLSETMSRVKVLIIDDIHLLMLTETNRKHITQWLNDFMSKNKQIVVTSVFPPKALSALEEAAGFQFTQGWMVDLKPPASQVYKTILAQLLQGLDVKLSEAELSDLFVKRSVPFGEAIRTLASMKKLEKFTVNAMNPATHAELLDRLLGLTEPGQGAPVPDEEYADAAQWKPGEAGSWFKWGLFYPKGMKRESSYVLHRIHKRSEEMGLKLQWQQVFLEEYNPDELYGIPFKVGNFASEHSANGVIIMGPQPTSALGAQEAEFRHITLKILDSFLVKGAWIQSAQMRSDAAYTKILMDLL